MNACRAPHLTAVALGSAARKFRSAEIAGNGNRNRPAGNTIPIVHTAWAAFDPTAHQAASP